MSSIQQLESLKAEILAEVQKMWLDEPIEVKKLRLGFIESGAGSYQQYFTTFVFADGEVRALGYLCLTTIQKLSQDADFDVVHLRKIAKSLLPICGEYLGYSGFEKMWDYIRRFQEILDTAKTKDGLYETAQALTLYVNRMHGWLHFYFPWSLGAHMRQLTKEDAQQLCGLAQQYLPAP